MEDWIEKIKRIPNLTTKQLYYNKFGVIVFSLVGIAYLSAGIYMISVTERFAESGFFNNLEYFIFELSLIFSGLVSMIIGVVIWKLLERKKQKEREADSNKL